MRATRGHLQNLRLGILAMTSLLLALPVTVEAASDDLDVPFVPTRDETVQEMMRLGEVKQGDVVYDLGSGDGRIVIAAAKQGARAIGIDKDPERIAEAKENAAAAGVEDQVEFRQGDIFETDFSEADVVTMYLLPTVNLRLRDKIMAMEPGTRIVSHAFDMAEWEPEQVSKDAGQTVYRWTVPAQVEGEWQWQVGQGEQARRYEVSLDQDFQKVSGQATVDGRPAQIKEAQLQGRNLVLVIQPENGDAQRFDARFEDGRLTAEVQGEQVVAERAGEAPPRG